MAEMDIPWVSLRDVAPLFNMTYESAKQAHIHGRLPVPARRLGRGLVCDKEAVLTYFRQFRQESLSQVERLCGADSD